MVLMASVATTSSFPITTLQSSSLDSCAKCTKLCGGGFKSKHNIAGGMHNMLLINPFEELIVHHHTVFSENFNIRSYEVDADCTASIQTLMNLLQETVLNRSRKSWFVDDGFGRSTPKMLEMGLVWVFIRFDWLMRDYQTGQILTRASCVSVMMNKLTRRLCRVPEEVRDELASLLVNSAPIMEHDNTEIPKLDDNSADYVCSGLRATRNDLDVNHHVNNVKYVGWILKSVPETMWESHEVAAMTLEYKRECGRDSKLQSLTAITSSDFSDDDVANNNIECNHLLRLDENNGAEVVRGRTLWRPK